MICFILRWWISHGDWGKTRVVLFLAQVLRVGQCRADLCLLRTIC